VLLSKLFSRKKAPEPEVEAEAAPQAPLEVSAILRQTSAELRQLSMYYALASMAAKESRDTISLQGASLKLAKLARQFEVTAKLNEQNRIEEDES
jgi:hypothetical protein